jgi:flagellar hook-length control protein FliK
MAELSDVLGNFSGVEVSSKVSPAESQCAPQPYGHTARIESAAAPEAEDSVTAAGKTALHSALGFGGEASQTAEQLVTHPSSTSAQVTPSASASQATPSQLDGNPQSTIPAAPLAQDAAASATVISASGAMRANSSDGGVHTSVADSSTGGGKPSQQNGQTSGDNLTSAAPIAPSTAINTAPDPAANLLGVHAPAATATHANTTTAPATPAPSAPATTLSAWQNYDGGAGSLVRSASLSGSANSAEMHVEFRSGVLGPLEVHTVMHDGAVGAEIHVQGQEAHTLLSAGLPSLERALGERNVRVENIAVYQDQAGGGMSGGGKQDSDSSPAPQQQSLPWNSPTQATPAADGSVQDEDSANPAAGLSVRA